jgi:hypothetical protein
MSTFCSRVLTRAYIVARFIGLLNYLGYYNSYTLRRAFQKTTDLWKGIQGELSPYKTRRLLGGFLVLFMETIYEFFKH